MTFEEKMQRAIQGAILKQIGEAKFVEAWNQKRHGIPEEIVDRVWESVDWDAVVATVSETLTERVAATITQAMLTEAKTDAKAVLSIQGVREKLRATAYPKVIEAIESCSS